MGTDPAIYEPTDRKGVDASAGALVSLNRSIGVGIHAVFGYLRDDSAVGLQALGRGEEGPVNGAFAGGRLELAVDDRDNAFTSRFGGRRGLWTETYGLQGGEGSFR